MTVQGATFRLTIKDWLQFMIAISACLTILGGVFTWSFPRIFPEWAAVPARIALLEASVDALSNGRPKVITFEGGGIVAFPTVRRGSSIAVTYILRRSIDCQTVINVRFWDHQVNTIEGSGSYQIPAVRAPVSPDLSPFTVRVRIPADLPPGRYSYAPEIVPVDCGVYGPIVAPMSQAFDVTE